MPRPDMRLWAPLVLLTAANVAPLLASKALGERWSSPLDGGITMADGGPLLGPSKTWRGCMASLVATTILAKFLGVDRRVAARLSLLSLGGDAMASFVKRRRGLVVHARSPWLDQLPEALLPLLVLRRRLRLSRADVADVVLAFVVMEEPWSRLLFKVGLRNRPY